MLKLTDVKIAYIYNKLSYLYASRVGIVMPINNFIMLLPGCLYYSKLTYNMHNGIIKNKYMISTKVARKSN